jgi:hypothetical protein
LFWALGVLVLVSAINSEAIAQKCQGSCSNSKSVCMQNTRGNTSICESRFQECMRTGTWIRNDRYRGAQVFENRCKR